MSICYLLLSPGAALQTGRGAGSCGAGPQLFRQYGAHVDRVVQWMLAFGTACCRAGGCRVLGLQLRCQHLIETAAAAAAAVRACGCGQRKTLKRQ